MSRMKHLLRKLHIGGSVNEHNNQSRFGDNLPTSNSNPSPNLSNTSATTSTSSSTSPSLSLPSSSASTRPVPVESAVDNSVDFNFFEEEFQVQLALAISASDPDGREDPESVQIKAAKRMSLGCPPSVAAEETLVEFLSLRYWNYNVVNYDEKVMDGFYDVYGITSNSTAQGKIPSLVDLQATSISDNVDYEVILVNRSIDPVLQQLEKTVISLSSECRVLELGPIASGLVQKIADLVVDTMGGPVGDAEEMLRRWTVRSYELRSSLNTIVLPLGCLDIGLSRHRALLFKVLADRISLPCRLVKGSYYTGTDEGAVNLIKIDYGSEFIIDLMGAPGTLIPAEIPNNHLQNSALDVMSSATIDQTIKDSNSAGFDLDYNSENRNEARGTSSAGSNLDSKVSGVGMNETSNQLKGGVVNVVQKNQTEKFEHEFGKLLPSLRRSQEGSSGTSGKASPAQKMKVKDVSKYVISAAQNPEFAQKLHAVLLESGASPPPDLFSNILPPRDVSEEKSDTNCFKVGIEQGDKFPPSTEHSFVRSDPHVTGDGNVTSQVHLPLLTTSEGFVLVDNGVNKNVQENCMDLALVPVAESAPSVDSYQRQLENAFNCYDAQSSQGNVGKVVNGSEVRGIVGQQIIKVTDEANRDSQYAIDIQNQRINSMRDEVAEWEIPWEDIQIGERIGLGSYGEVYRADWNGTEVAVKKFLDQDFSGDALEQFRCEIGIMLRLRHPNVVLFMGAVTRPPNLSILTEFLPRGSLYRLLHRPNIQLDEKRRLRMALDVAKGMNYLHTSHPTIVHRDLKSPNLLVDKNWVVKVCDFGLSRLKHNTFLRIRTQMEINTGAVQSNYRMLICSRHQPSTSLSSLPPRFFLNRRRPIIHSSSQRLSSTAHFLLHRQFSEQRPRCAIHDGVTTNEPVANPSLMVKDKAARISPGLKGTSIFLVGINSAVKTNLGKALADALRYYYFDSDSLVEQAGGQESAGQSFRERDEKGFMDAETEVLKQLSAMGRLVVCAGDGAVQSSTNLAFLRYGISIWIDTPLDMVAREVLESPGGENSSNQFIQVLAKLRDQYERMRGGYGTADATISVQKIAGKLGYDSMDAVTVEDLAIEILQEIERLTRAKRMMEDAARPF